MKWCGGVETCGDKPWWCSLYGAEVELTALGKLICDVTNRQGKDAKHRECKVSWLRAMHQNLVRQFRKRNAEFYVISGKLY